MLDSMAAVMSSLTARQMNGDFDNDVRYPNGKYPRATGSRSSGPFGIYKCGDGKYIAIIGLQQSFFHGLCKGLNCNKVYVDQRFTNAKTRGQHKMELTTLLEKALSKKSMQEWLPILEREGVPVAAVNNLKEAVQEPQMKWRNMIVETTNGMKVIGNPVKISSYQDPKIVNASPTNPSSLKEVLSKL